MIQKLFVETMIVGEFYAFNCYKCIDAHHQVWYVAEPVGRGATRLADKYEDLKPLLEAEVPILNSFLQRVK